MALKPGDGVQIASRPVTSDDEKNGLYFSYFGGLTGAVDRSYDDGSVCVDIDLESLTDDMRKRHSEMQETERKRWLEGLSGEVRNRLTPEQRQLTMAYKLLVHKKDLEPTKGGKPKSAAPKGEEPESGSASARKGPARAPDPEEPAQAADIEAPAPKPEEKEPEPERLSEADLAAREEEYLKSLQKND